MNDNIINPDECLCYVNHGLKLIQKKDSLLYGTDAYLLSAYIRKTGGMAYEFGAGSGIITFLCAQNHKFDKIRALEVQTELADVIKRNIDYNGFGENVSCHCIDIRNINPVGDTLGLGKTEYADAVFSNPPYMTVSCGKMNQNELKYKSRHEVAGNIFDFCKSAKSILKHGALFYCVWRPDRLIDLLYAMRENMLEPKRMTYVCDNEGSRPSMVLIEAKKGAAPSLFVTPTLILKNNGAPTLDAQYIYEHGEFDEKFRKK